VVGTFALTLDHRPQRRGVTAEQGGDLGALTESQLPPDLAGAIFSMDEGAIEGPIKSDFGFHVVLLDRIIEPGPMPLEQVSAELMTELQDQRADALFRDLERQLSDALFDAGDINALAAAVGADVQTVEGFTRDGGEPFGSELVVINAVFDEMLRESGQLSEIVEIDAGRSAVFTVNNYQAATRQPLDEVRDDVIANVKLDHDSPSVAVEPSACLRLATVSSLARRRNMRSMIG